MSVEETIHSTADELRSLITRAEVLLADGGADADVKIVEMRDRLRELVDKSRTQYDRMRDNARVQLGKGDDYIREHPYHAIGLAAVVGVLAGILISRRP
jgi:ElaB protein